MLQDIPWLFPVIKSHPMQTPCNGNNSNKDIRIMADGFIYKKNHWSLCHGFQNYFNITLKMKYCLGEFYDYFEGLMTALDESWVLDISQNMEHIMSHVQTSYTLPVPNALNCSQKYSNLCFNPFLINSYCGLCHGLSKNNKKVLLLSEWCSWQNGIELFTFD